MSLPAGPALARGGLLAVPGAKLALVFADIVTGQRQDALILGQLKLDYHEVLIAERRLGAREIHFPHPAEALAEPFRRRVPGGAEALAPVAQGDGVMQPQDGNVGGEKAFSL